MHTINLTNGIWTLVLSEDGRVLSLSDGEKELVQDPHSPICELRFQEDGVKKTIDSATLLRHDQTSAAFDCSVELGKPGHLRFEWEIRTPDEFGTAVTCTVDLSSVEILDLDVLLRWTWNFQLPFSARKLFAPLFDGRGMRTSPTKRTAWRYECAGGWGVENGEQLAMPLLDEYSFQSTLRLSHFADPFFSTGFDLPMGTSAGFCGCKFLCVAGPQQFQKRTFGIFIHHGDAHTAVEAFFRHGIPDCPPGPGWLHEIAMVDYDFLSKKGRGWYRDIDKLTELIPRSDRHRVLLALHGWYDLLGHYCYDESAKRLVKEWIAMPTGDKLPMNLSDVHERIAYAKDRGFRVALYFADGTAIDSGGPRYSEGIVFREPSGQLRKHHWGGPDTLAQTYIMNPLHPKVQSFFRSYLKALLNEFGKEIDALNWDETFTIKVGDVSTAQYPGYADRAFMLLSKELREIVKGENSQIAFLASDCTGLMLPQDDGSYWRALPAQNALVFDGTFQDSHCYPTAWQYGLFPNYRNVLWSCNWSPLKDFEWTDTGVRIFGVPVAISNGWGEDKGISDCSEVEVRKIMELFEFRKNLRARIRWLDVTADE
jgi:hypothetical protein